MKRKETLRPKTEEKAEVCLFVGWLLNVPATCECISGMLLLLFLLKEKGRTDDDFCNDGDENDDGKK